MNIKQIALKIFLLFLFCIPGVIAANAETFVVTSNNDNNGTGTLRQAVRKANYNGIDETDTIRFDLPGTSEENRTITLLDALSLSSNLIIDGTTQPGAKLGISDAKVIIQFTPLASNDFLTGFQSFNLKDIGIFGLYFKVDTELSAGLRFFA